MQAPMPTNPRLSTCKKKRCLRLCPATGSTSCQVYRRPACCVLASETRLAAAVGGSSQYKEWSEKIARCPRLPRNSRITCVLDLDELTCGNVLAARKKRVCLFYLGVKEMYSCLHTQSHAIQLGDRQDPWRAARRHGPHKSRNTHAGTSAGLRAGDS